MVKMAQKLPACDPCRALKLACDHAQPCTRCLERGRESRCVYRPRPFKRSSAKAQRLSPVSISERSPTNETRLSNPDAILSVEGSAQLKEYPDPGYLGSSSHTAFFDRLQLDNGVAQYDAPNNCTSTASLRFDIPVDENLVSLGSNLLLDISRTPNMASFFEIVELWVSKGANLGLAEPLTQSCTLQAKAVVSRLKENPNVVANMSKEIFAQSSLPISADATTTLKDFCKGFSESTASWETLGLFFTAACRAATDLTSLEGAYDTWKSRKDIQKLSIHYSNKCLDMCQGLNNPGDLHLFLQYENFICHSQIDGDQSYRSWCKLGNVASSLFALGYHQQTDGETIPAFLKRLRQVAFGRCYSADKNVSIFLGRPPRIMRRFCRTHIQLAEDLGGTTEDWHCPDTCNYMADTRWAVICAIMKEDILGLSSEADFDNRTRQACTIQTEIESQWMRLPSCYRLEGSLRSWNRSPIERDFILTAKLSYLHVQFLLRLAVLQRVSDYDQRLFEISIDMFSLVIDGVLWRHQLINSGSSLIWKVVYFGLAAAGIICLSLMNRPSITIPSPKQVSMVVQNLSTLVAEVERGTLVDAEHPNYALLIRATKTVDSLLSRLIGSSTAIIPAQTHSQEALQTVEIPEDNDQSIWNIQAHEFNMQDFEMTFWLNLSEHPFLTS